MAVRCRALRSAMQIAQATANASPETNLRPPFAGLYRDGTLIREALHSAMGTAEPRQAKACSGC